jgi:hypothetical protein
MAVNKNKPVVPVKKGILVILTEKNDAEIARTNGVDFLKNDDFGKELAATIKRKDLNLIDEAELQLSMRKLFLSLTDLGGNLISPKKEVFNEEMKNTLRSIKSRIQRGIYAFGKGL